MKGCLPGSSSQTQHPSFYQELAMHVSSAQLMPKSPTSKKSSVLSINHTSYANSLGTVRHPFHSEKALHICKNCISAKLPGTGQPPSRPHTALHILNMEHLSMSQYPKAIDRINHIKIQIQNILMAQIHQNQIHKKVTSQGILFKLKRFCQIFY